MRGAMAALCVLAGLLAETAGAQTINLRISPREDGGETVGLGRSSPSAADPARPQPRTADGQAVVARADAMVIDDITRNGRLSPSTARRAMERLSGEAVVPPRLDRASQVLFYRTVAYAAALTGDATLASRAARQWVRVDPADGAALRAHLVAAMLNRDRTAAVKAAERLAAPAQAAWAPWARYMAPLASRAGERPEMELTTVDGRSLRLADLRGTVVVLYFWTAASGGDGAAGEALAAQRRLAEAHRGDSVAVVGINLDEKVDRDSHRVVATLRREAGDLPQIVRGTAPDGSAERAMDRFGVTAVPTGVVLATDGSVIFAGDPRTWEIHTAIDYALSADPHAVAAGTREPDEPPADPATPATPDEAIEREAKQLRDEGWDLLRLGLKTGSAAHRRQGRDLLERVIRDYPDTRAAEQARRDLIASER
ncbi:MAG: TlpA family protein disulfide reductase [Planctomycetota bacterium]